MPTSARYILFSKMYGKKPATNQFCNSRQSFILWFSYGFFIIFFSFRLLVWFLFDGTFIHPIGTRD